MEFSPTKKEWNEMIEGQPHAQFLQSYEWGLFQKALGRRVWYLKEGTAQCLAIRYTLKGTMFYIMCPRGPVGEVNKEWWQQYLAWSKNQGALFSRIEPINKNALPSDDSRHVRDVEP